MKKRHYHRKDGWQEMILSYNGLFSIYACLKLQKYHKQYLLYFLATIPVLQKRSKFERMSGCNRSVITQKWKFIEWIPATGLTG